MRDVSHLFFRIAIGALMFLVHGLSKWQNLLSQNSWIDFPVFFGLSSKYSLTLAALTESLFPLMIILGIATRISSAILIILMSIIVFDVHGNDPFYPKQELALIYGLCFSYFLLAGNGEYAMRNRLFPRFDNNVFNRLLS